MSFPHVRSTTQWRSAEREYIYRLLREGKITDEARRRIERELDLEEASIACKKEGGVEPPL
jgi:CPA1 family monovalent cation:H+ antiporter